MYCGPVIMRTWLVDVRNKKMIDNMILHGRIFPYLFLSLLAVLLPAVAVAITPDGILCNMNNGVDKEHYIRHTEIVL